MYPTVPPATQGDKAIPGLQLVQRSYKYGRHIRISYGIPILIPSNLLHHVANRSTVELTGPAASRLPLVFIVKDAAWDKRYANEHRESYFIADEPGMEAYRIVVTKPSL